VTGRISKPIAKFWASLELFIVPLLLTYQKPMLNLSGCGNSTLLQLL
jgi:hypothetical protein